MVDDEIFCTALPIHLRAIYGHAKVLLFAPEVRVHGKLQLLEDFRSRPAERERPHPLRGQSAGGIVDLPSRPEITELCHSIGSQTNVQREG